VINAVTPIAKREKACVLTRYLPGRTEYYVEDQNGIRTRHASYEEAKKVVDHANHPTVPHYNPDGSLRT
jgi:hypothetical protein